MRGWRLLFSLMFLAEFSSTSFAGPIAYTFGVTSTSSEGTPSPGPLVYSLDSHGDVCVLPGERVTLGTVRFGLLMEAQAAESYQTTTQFNVSVSIADAASGASTVLKVYGAAVDQWDYRTWDGLWRNPYHSLEIADPWTHTPFSVRATLGANRYLLQVDERENGTLAEFTLTVTPEPAATPEPGTLILAALGLAPLGSLRLRRRPTTGHAHVTETKKLLAK